MNSAPNLCTPSSIIYSICSIVIPSPCLVSQIPSPCFHTAPVNNENPSWRAERGRTYIVAYIEGFWDPITRNACFETGRDEHPVYIESRVTTGHVDVAGEPCLVDRVADEKDAFNGGKGGVSQVAKRVDGGCGTLGVSLEYKTLVCVGGESRVDLVDDLAFAELVSRLVLLARKQMQLASSVAAVEFWSQSAGYTTLYCVVFG